jgi:hypothetical protein
MCVATFKNKSNGIELFETMAAVTFGRTITKQSWIQRIPLIGLEESLQGVEELEVNVKISVYCCVWTQMVVGSHVKHGCMARVNGW